MLGSRQRFVCRMASMIRTGMPLSSMNTMPRSSRAKRNRAAFPSRSLRSGMRKEPVSEA